MYFIVNLDAYTVTSSYQTEEEAQHMLTFFQKKHKAVSFSLAYITE